MFRHFPTPMCPICEKEVETIEHILFRCSWAVAVWFGSGLSYWVQDQWIETADKWVEEVLCGRLGKEAGSEVVGLLFQTCWAIWKTRNDSIFNAVLPSPESTMIMAQHANSDYLQAVFKLPKESGTLTHPSRAGKWIPPPDSVTKFNCDGAYSSSRSKAAFGFLARDSGGQALFWRTGKVAAMSALFTEAWALRIACATAIDLEITRAVFELDCKEIIDCISKKDYQCPWEIEVIIADVKRWAAHREWSFSWVYREKNRVAQWLASQSLARNFIYSPGCILPDMEILLTKDRPP